MKIKVGEHRIPVRALTKEEAKGARALYNPQPRWIGVDASETPFDQVDGLLHEIVHAIWEHLGMGKRVSEESAATKFGTALTTIFLANPLLISAIAAALYHRVPIVTKESTP